MRMAERTNCVDPAGGILGGLSTGQTIVARVAFKPTSSILTPRQSIDASGAEMKITPSHHEPFHVGIRGAGGGSHDGVRAGGRLPAAPRPDRRGLPAGEERSGLTVFGGPLP